MAEIFKTWLEKRATEEIKFYIGNVDFPEDDDYWKIKQFLNLKINGEYIPDRIIEQFERQLDEYETLKAGGSVEAS